MHIKAMSMRHQLVIAISMLALLAGCQLPDVSGFSGAAAAASDGVAKTGSVFRAEVHALRQRMSPHAPSRARLARHLDSFDEAWKVRTDAMAALSAYAESLVSVVEANESGRQAAEELGGALGDVAGVFGAAGLASSAAFKVGVEAYQLIATGVATVTLARAVEEAHPHIKHAVTILLQDLDSIAGVLDELEQSTLTELEDTIYNDAQYSLSVLRSRRNALAVAIDEHNRRPAAAGTPDEEDPTLLLDETITLLLEEVRVLEENIDRQREHVEKVDARIARTRALFNEYRVLVEESASTISELERSHGQLVAAVRERRAFSATNLLYAAERLSETAERVRELTREHSSE